MFRGRQRGADFHLGGAASAARYLGVCFGSASYRQSSGSRGSRGAVLARLPPRALDVIRIMAARTQSGRSGTAPRPRSRAWSTSAWRTICWPLPSRACWRSAWCAGSAAAARARTRTPGTGRRASQDASRRCGVRRARAAPGQGVPRVRTIGLFRPHDHRRASDRGCHSATADGRYVSRCRPAAGCRRGRHAGPVRVRCCQGLDGPNRNRGSAAGYACRLKANTSRGGNMGIATLLRSPGQ